MPRKKTPKISPIETIHFRPGRDLGGRIDQLASELMLSRGETAKRVVSLALRDMDLEGFYPLANRLVELEYDGITFDEACHRLHVAIIQEEAKSQQGNSPSVQSKEERLEIAKGVIRGYELMRGIESHAETHQLRIQLFRTNS